MFGEDDQLGHDHRHITGVGFKIKSDGVRVYLNHPLNLLKTQTEERADIGIEQDVIGEYHVVGSQRFAIGEFGIFPQVNLHRHFIIGQLKVLGHKAIAGIGFVIIPGLDP